MKVVLSPLAVRSLREIEDWSEMVFGEEAASKYVDFLISQMEALSSQPHMGFAVRERPGLRALVVRRRLGAHGHVVVYRVREAEGILGVAAIFHTRQNWRRAVRNLSEDS